MISVVSKMLKRNRNRVKPWEETTSNNDMLDRILRFGVDGGVYLVDIV